MVWKKLLNGMKKNYRINKNKKAIVIFGANSYIATCLISKLSKKKEFKIFFVARNKISIANSFTYKNLNKLQLNLNKNFNKIFFYNFACNTNVEDYLKNRKLTIKNVFSYQKIILDFSNKINNSTFILVSSDRVFGKLNKIAYPSSIPKPIDPYAITKFKIENYFKKYLKNQFIIIRATNVYGPNQKSKQLLPKIIEQTKNFSSEIHVGNLNSFRDYIYIDDLIDGLIKILRINDKKNLIFHFSNKKIYLKSIINHINSYFLKKNIDKKIISSKDNFRKSKFELGNFKLACYSSYNKLCWSAKTDFFKGLNKILNNEFKKFKKTNR